MVKVCNLFVLEVVMWKGFFIIFILTLNGCTTYVHRYEIAQSTNPQLNSSNQLGQIMNGKQLCLSFSAGQIVNLKSCDGGTTQQWVYEPQTALLRNPISGLCLDVAADVVTSGVFLAGKPCRNAPSQQWFFDRQNLYNSMGWCIDEVKETTQTAAYLAACSTRPAQQFHLIQLNQPVSPYLAPQSPTTVYQPLVIQDRTYYSPFFYTYPYFYWNFYYNYPHRPIHHHPPHRHDPPRHHPTQPVPIKPQPVDKNRDGRYDRGDLDRNDSLKGRIGINPPARPNKLKQFR
jgi:hypothetical protein